MEGQEESKLRLEDLRIETASVQPWKPVTEASDKDAPFKAVEISSPKGESQAEEAVVLAEDSSAADTLTPTAKEPAESVQSIGQNARSAEAPPAREESPENMAVESNEHGQLQDSTLDSTRVQDLEPVSGSKLTGPEEPQKEEPETKNSEAIVGKTTVLDESQHDGAFFQPDNETLKCIQHESHEDALDEKLKTDEPNTAESPHDKTAFARSTSPMQCMPTEEPTVDEKWIAESLSKTGVNADEPKIEHRNTVESIHHKTVSEESTQAAETQAEEPLTTEDPDPVIRAPVRAALEELTPAVDTVPEKLTFGESKALETSQGQIIEPDILKQSQDQAAFEDLTSTMGMRTEESTVEMLKVTDYLPDPPALEISTTGLKIRTGEPSAPGDPRVTESAPLQAAADDLAVGSRTEVPTNDDSTTVKRLQNQAVLEDSGPVAEAKPEYLVEMEDPEAMASAPEQIELEESATLIETKPVESVAKVPTTAECLPDQTVSENLSPAVEIKPENLVSAMPTAEDQRGSEKLRPSVESNTEKTATHIFLAVEESKTTEVLLMSESELDPKVSEDSKPIVENKLEESTIDDPNALTLLRVQAVFVASIPAAKDEPEESAPGFSRSAVSAPLQAEVDDFIVGTRLEVVDVSTMVKRQQDQAMLEDSVLVSEANPEGKVKTENPKALVSAPEQIASGESATIETKPAELVANVPTTAESPSGQTALENSSLAIEIKLEEPLFKVPTAEDQNGLKKSRPFVESNTEKTATHIFLAVEDPKTTEVSQMSESALDPKVSEDSKPIVENKLEESTIDDPNALTLLRVQAVFVASIPAAKDEPEESSPGFSRSAVSAPLQAEVDDFIVGTRLEVVDVSTMVKRQQDQAMLEDSVLVSEANPEGKVKTENPKALVSAPEQIASGESATIETKPAELVANVPTTAESPSGQTALENSSLAIEIKLEEPLFKVPTAEDQNGLKKSRPFVESNTEKTATHIFLAVEDPKTTEVSQMSESALDPKVSEDSKPIVENKLEESTIDDPNALTLLRVQAVFVASIPAAKDEPEESSPGFSRSAVSAPLQAEVDDFIVGTRLEVVDVSTMVKRQQDQAMLEDSVLVSEANPEGKVKTENPKALVSAPEQIASGESATIETKPAELVANVPTTAESPSGQTALENSSLAIEIKLEEPLFKVPTAEDQNGLKKSRPFVESHIEETAPQISLTVEDPKTTEVSQMSESALDPIVSEDSKPIVENKLEESTIDDPNALTLLRVQAVFVASIPAAKDEPKETVSDELKPAESLQGQSTLKEATSAVLSTNCKPVEDNQLVDDEVVDKLPVELKEVKTTPATVLEDDDCSYEEIVVDDDDEFFEYVDEILDEEDEEDMFTDVTYESQDRTDEQFIVNGSATDGSNPGRPVAKSQSSRSSMDGSNHRRPVVKGQPSRSSLDGSNHRRPVIKSATQKALEEEEARKRAEAEEALKSVEYRLARQNSFTCKDEAFLRQLEREEAEHIRHDEERERQRIAEQERLAQIKAAEAAARISRQEKEELRRRLMEEEARRKSAEAEAHRLAAEAAARENEAAERARRKAEESERRERETKKKAMENEVRRLEAKLAEAKKAAVEAKLKQVEEKNRLKAKVEARRKEKKEMKERATESSAPEVSRPARGSKATAVGATSPEGVSKVSVSGAVASPTRLSKASGGLPAPKEVAPVSSTPIAVPASAKSTSANTTSVYYTADELRKESVPGLDYKNREIYLHPDDFQQFFGMTLAEFDMLPKWKKTSMKRKQKLF